VIDGIVPEPESGAHMNHGEAAMLLGASIQAALDELEDIPGDELRRMRRAKYRTIGALKAAAH
jgi:acetyl-CoA carboxylase alpha subunit